MSVQKVTANLSVDASKSQRLTIGDRKMRYAMLGNTGVPVSRLGFGAMTFGEVNAAHRTLYKVDQPLADRLVAQAVDGGINYFNTADVYAGGRSEEMLGIALGRRRRHVLVATKCGIRTGRAPIHAGLSRRHIIASCDASLKRLGTDWIDVYLVHRVDPLTPIEETLAGLDMLVRSGKVRYVGFSNWPDWLAAKAIGIQRLMGQQVFSACEMYYSLIGRDIEDGFLPFAADAGLGVTVWSPLAGGFLTGRYTRETPDGGDGRLATFDAIPIDRDRGYPLVAMLQEIARGLEATPAQLAIAWLLQRRGIASVLLGASSTAQLDQTIAAAEIKLDAATVTALDDATRPALRYPTWLNAQLGDTPLLDSLDTP